MIVLSVREFQESDRAAVIRLWTECKLVVPWNDPNKDIDSKLGVNPELFLTGHDQEGIAATVMGGYEGHRGWINYLAVSPAKRRKGYGEYMMRSVEALLEAKGCPKINLQIRSSNREVIAFYQSLGYAIDDVVGMGKRLDN